MYKQFYTWNRSEPKPSKYIAESFTSEAVRYVKLAGSMIATTENNNDKKYQIKRSLDYNTMS